MTNEQLRAVVADSMRQDNKEFIRQIREGEQDDGPFMLGAFAVMEYINSHCSLLPISEPVDDE
jgi:hypothetical protein